MWPNRLWGFESPFSHPLSLPIPRALALVLLLGVGAGGCASTPGEVVIRAFDASQRGDFEQFCGQFTVDSCRVLRGFSSLGIASGGGVFVLPPKGEVPTILKSDFRPGAGLIRTEKGQLRNVDLVIVFVSAGEEVLPVPLIEQRGRWRIDLFMLKTQWSMLGRLSATFSESTPGLGREPLR